MTYPHIVLITTDSLRTDALEVAGLMPNLARLRREGIRFTEGHTVSPVCQPARCSLVTGLHTPLHGSLENGLNPHNTHRHYVEDLKEAGYRTAISGKSHFGRIPAAYDHRWEQESGWWKEKLKAEGVDPSQLKGTKLEAPEVKESLLKDFQITEKSIELIDELAAEQGPFYLHCSYNAPHDPLSPPPEWIKKVEELDLPEPNHAPGDLDNIPGMLTEDLKLTAGGEEYLETDGTLKEEYVRRRRLLYYAYCAWLDGQIGRVLSAIERNGLKSETVVLFSSDHGHALYDHALYDKHNYHDESWRVPFILSHPGQLPEGTAEGFALWTDIAPTLLAVAGIQDKRFNGYDLYTPMRRNEANPRQFAVATLLHSMALATREWKIEYYPQDGTGRLYNRKADPGEHENLWGKADYMNLQENLLKALMRWRINLIDIETLNKLCTTGGPIANNVTASVERLKGTAADDQLKADLVELGLI